MQDLAQIHAEVQLIRERNPGLSDDNAFVYWFLSAYLLDSDDPDSIKNCIVGAKGDINVDAFHLDEANRKIFLVQAKYHDNSSKSESRDQIISFLALEDQLHEKDKLENLLTNANDQMKLVLTDVHKKLTKHKYDLVFLYVSTERSMLTHNRCTLRMCIG